MKIVQDAPIAVNAREIKSFGSLTDGTGADDGGQAGGPCGGEPSQPCPVLSGDAWSRAAAWRRQAGQRQSAVRLPDAGSGSR